MAVRGDTQSGAAMFSRAGTGRAWNRPGRHVRSAVQRRMIGDDRAGARGDLGESGVAHHRQPARGEFAPAAGVRGRDSRAGSPPRARPCAPCPTAPTRRAARRARPAPSPCPPTCRRSGFSHSTGPAGSGAAGGSGSSRSVPDTWSLASSLGQPSSGTGGKTRTSGVLTGDRDPGQRARLAPLRAARPPHHLADPGVLPVAHGPRPLALARADRSSDEERPSTARAAVSSASLRAGGSVFSMCTTSGSTNCGASSRGRRLRTERAVGGGRGYVAGRGSGMLSLLTPPVCQAVRGQPFLAERGAPGEDARA